MKNIAKINSLPSSCIFFYAEWTHDLRAPPIYHRGHLEKKIEGKKIEGKKSEKNRKKILKFYFDPSSTIHVYLIYSLTFSSTGRVNAALQYVVLRFCDEAWKNDPGRTNNFLEKKKFFENCFLSMVSAPICIYRNLFTSIHYKDTGSELFGFTVYSIGNENSFCFKKRVFLSLRKTQKKRKSFFLRIFFSFFDSKKYVRGQMSSSNICPRPTQYRLCGVRPCEHGLGPRDPRTREPNK